jgi:hypothetical protein
MSPDQYRNLLARRTFFHLEVVVEVQPGDTPELIECARMLEMWDPETNEQPDNILQNAVHNIIDSYLMQMMHDGVPIEHVGITTSKPIVSSRKRAHKMIDQLLGIPTVKVKGER